MRSISGKKFCKVLEKKGWKCARIHGSHFVYMKEGSDLRITVPVHKNKNLKTGLLKALMKMGEIKEKEL
ncbi:type II toxin-antitoxin system HicA family toxin [candidate division KSB1 bacterium]|nr:type II toxin-antitoxin system HicA family toxin [candidate division KSB1 bacterium]